MRSSPLRTLARVLCGLLFVADLVSRLSLASSLSLTKDELRSWDASSQPGAAFASIPLASIRLSCAALGETPLGVRLPSVVAATGAAAFLLAFVGALRLGAWVGAATLALVLSTAWFHYVGSVAHPDAFLALFWMGALWALARSSRAGSWRGAWILVGALLAAAATLSHDTGFLLWPAWAITSLARGPWRRRSWPWLLAGTAVWLTAISPALLAVVEEGRHWTIATFQFSDLSRGIPVGARIPALFVAPAIALFTPGYVVYAIGLLHAWWRLKQPTSRWGLTGALTAFPVLLAAVRGSIRGTWILPSFWGTLPRGAAFFLAGPGRSAILALLVATGTLATTAMHATMLEPDLAAELGSRIPEAGAIDRSYASTVSAQELRHTATRTWLDRAYEFHLTREAVDSVTARAAAFDSSAAVVTNLYEIALAARFYGTARPIPLTEDARFSRTDLFLADEGFWPETTIYVTSPGTRLPEPFFLRYGYLEREEELLVPVGRLGTRTYDVWRCGPETR